AAASGAPDVFGLGPGILLGLAVAYLGQGSIHAARRRNAVDVRAEEAALDAGDPAAIRRVHMRGIGRDALRALIVTAVGLLGALALRTMPPIGVRGSALLQLVSLGAAIGVASLGAARVAGSGVGRVWLAAGLTLGLAWVILR
ncbi:MAG TPA: hypothetical protein VNL18_11730, partial [Gemmatimonadales bacterium]|nr:hypothetical protein [Gemmatimonadales bacterium]